MHWVERWFEPCFESLLTSCEDDEGVVILDSSSEASPSSRYSYVCLHPFASFRVKSGQAIWNDLSVQQECPWAFLKARLQAYHIPHDPTLPPFQGGIAGYWGYELAHTLESFPQTVDEIQFDDCVLFFYSCVAAYDHVEKELILMATGFPAQTLEAREKQAQIDLARVKRTLLSSRESPSSGGLSAGSCDVKPQPLIQGPIHSNFTRESYCAAVSSMKASIRTGDFFQANLTQLYRATLCPEVSRLAWYKTLRKSHPAPFGAYMRVAKDAWILSYSPERFIRLQGSEVRAEPIKGTRKRFLDNASMDEAMQQALLHSEKDRAENVMIVDLMRNDLARVCLPGSVKVETLCALTTFATVHHLVSTVVGVLKPQQDAIDLLKSVFPPGSVTGAPKIKAMEKISMLEKQTRGPYCGCLGYIGFSKAMDTAVTIRTYVVKGDEVFFGAGGAIILDSDPQAEYEESITKVAALRERLEHGFID
ncbi:MAG: anthranilate synthase component I family protein [Gammaproteobacteria bacterium]|nr:anthranilate synthase component I family protein [Gammaproteobacteria bacterium]